MKLTTAEAKKRHSFNYVEYFETQLYYQCVMCSKIVKPEMGHCSECIEELDPNNRQQLFCCECRQPITHKRDYFINEEHSVSHYPVNYLTCQCSENLWIPFREIPNTPTPDPTTRTVLLTSDNIKIWAICCADPSQYNNNEDIDFINCQQREQDLFLRAYIGFNIGRTELPASEHEKFTDRYYRICSDVISLGIKLGILSELIRDENFRRMWVPLKNRIQEIFDFSSGRYFADELLSSLLENCFARLRRLFNPPSPRNNPRNKDNTVERYRDDFLKISYPETHAAERKKYGIRKLGGELKALINQQVVHDDIGSNRGISVKDCQTLFKFYSETVLKSIHKLNKMQQFNLSFNYEDSLSPLGLENTGGSILHGFLKPLDNFLTSHKREQALELLGLDNSIDNRDLSPDERKIYERKRDIYESNLASFFGHWIVWDHQEPLNIITPDGQHFEMPYGFKSMRVTETTEGDYIIYIKTPSITLCPNYRIECFGSDQNFARQVFRKIDEQRYKQKTVDLSKFEYNPSLTLL